MLNDAVAAAQFGLRRVVIRVRPHQVQRGAVLGVACDADADSRCHELSIQRQRVFGNCRTNCFRGVQAATVAVSGSKTTNLSPP